MEIVGALVAGLFIGGVLGFVGSGGAMLTVPILIYFFDFTPYKATTAALAVVFLASLSGAIPKVKSREILYRDALIISGIGLITNVGFSSISDRFPERFITTGFAAILILAGATMLKSPISLIHTRIPVSILVVISLFIGAMTGIFGIGGGFLAIPILVLFFGTPQSIAAGTSLLIISINSLIALIAHNRIWSEIDWHIPALMSLSAIVVASASSHFGNISSPALLRKAFALLLFSVATFTVMESWLL